MNTVVSMLLTAVCCLMAAGPAAAEHPFLICKRSEFSALRARAAAEPWKSMKADAIAASNAGVTTSDGTTLQQYVGACALAYILDTDRSATHKNRVRDAILQKLDKIAFDPKQDWSGTVPPMAAAFVCILGLDVVYDDLTASEISSCEAKIKSKIDLISKTGSWPAARMGTHGTWDIYKGIRTTRDDAYYQRYTEQMTVDGVSTVAPNYAFARLGSKDDRLQKGAYADVLEYTGLDNRFYTNSRLKAFYRWLFGCSVNPAKQYYMFGDVAPRFLPENSAMLWRVGRFDYQASQYAAWLLKGSNPPGHLLSYVLMQNALPAPLVPSSTLLMKGAAVFREPQDSKYALGCALYNITRNDEWHTHEETNGISCGAYGTRLLVNGGWLGDVCRPADKNNTLTVNGQRHRVKKGAGLTEGLLGTDFDYACGASGGALGDDSFDRSLVLVHSQDGVDGYFAVIDEVDADAGEKVNMYLHPSTSSSATEEKANTEYSADINYFAGVSGVKLSVFYATAPASVTRSMVNSGDLTRDPSIGQHARLEAKYSTDVNGDARAVTILYPHNASHAKAAMTRISGSGYSGAKIAMGSGYSDYVCESGGSADKSVGGITFRARAVLFRQLNSELAFYFARKGRKFTNGTYGFESSADISIHMKGEAGNIISGGTDVSFYYPGITGVSLDGVPAAVKSTGSGWCRIGVPAGSFAVTVLIDGSSAVDSTAPGIGSVTAGPGPDVLQVVFDETVDRVSAGTASNYRISGLDVLSATPVSDGRTVTLTTSTMRTGIMYTLSVSGISDMADPANIITGTVTGDFRYELCTASDEVWVKKAIPEQTGTFDMTWSVTPQAAVCNALFTLSAVPASAYSDCAVLVRLGTDGSIDARNGGTYEAENTVNYAMGTRYAFSMTVDVPAKTYSVSVTPEGGSETVIAHNYAFRTEQDAVSSLGFWNIQDDRGDFKVCDMAMAAMGSINDCRRGSVQAGPAGAVYTLDGRPVHSIGACGPGMYLVQQPGQLKKILVLDKGR